LGFGKKNGDGTVLNANDISNLESKNIDDLILLGCNTGLLDYKDTNPAAAFSQIIDGGSVLARDGTVYDMGRQMLLWGHYLYQSQNDGAFYSQLTGIRPTIGIWPVDNEGWVLYNYADGEVNTTCYSNRYTLTIKGLLGLMK
jgi:hypothetical protein